MTSLSPDKKQMRIKVMPENIDKINIDPDNNEVQIYLRKDKPITDLNTGNTYNVKPGTEPIMRKHVRPEDMHIVQDELYKMVHSKEPDQKAASTRFMEVLDSLEVNPWDQ
jgi:hypothetical protein